MHTLLIHQAFTSPAEAGGTRHFELAQHMSQVGHRFTIVASNLSYLSGQSATEQNRLVYRQKIGDVQILRTYAYASLHKSFIWRVVSFLSFMITSVWAALSAGPVDVVMGTTPPIFQAVSAVFVAKLRRRPLLLEVRDLWPEFAIDMGVLRNSFLIALARKLERFLYQEADHILVNSPAYQKYLVAQGVSEAKISLIANGVSVDQFDPSSLGESIREKYGLCHKFVITYAGALGLANDIPNILAAAELLRENTHIHFLLVGDGKERGNLERVVAEKKLTNVTFTGPQPKSKVGEFLAASDACIATLQPIPMFTTTYPNKVFDYMAAGRPTLLAIDGVIREVVEAADGGIFVPPGDSKRLAVQVLAWSLQPEDCRAMGERARAYVQENFDRKSQARDFQSLLEQISVTDHKSL